MAWGRGSQMWNREDFRKTLERRQANVQEDRARVELKVLVAECEVQIWLFVGVQRLFRAEPC